MPIRDKAAGAVVSPTAAHWFDRPPIYGEARRVLAPGSVLAIVEYARDESDPLAASLVAFMAQYGSRRAYAALDYRSELAVLDGFAEINDVVLPRLLELHIDEFRRAGAVLVACDGLVERFGDRGARDRLRSLAAPHRIDEDHVAFGYRFTCLTGAPIRDRRAASNP